MLVLWQANTQQAVDWPSEAPVSAQIQDQIKKKDGDLLANKIVEKTGSLDHIICLDISRYLDVFDGICAYI
jgi:hypothetical protein